MKYSDIIAFGVSGVAFTLTLALSPQGRGDFPSPLEGEG